MIAPRPQLDQTTAMGRLPTLNAEVTETSRLLLLPPELLIENFRYLDHQSILRCSSVSMPHRSPPGVLDLDHLHHLAGLP